MMIFIKNLKVFNCSIKEIFHWSKLPKLKNQMRKQSFYFPCYADLSYADLCHADLRYADLSYADLRNADLRNADLSYADLRNADLRNADLRNAYLRNAYLRNADLSNADLRNADLRNAYLRNADLSNANLNNAKLIPIDNQNVIIEDFMSVCGLGSENRQTLIFKTNIGIVIQCGCFYGTERQFKKQVKETHGTNNYAKEYIEMLKLAKIRFNRGENDR